MKKHERDSKKPKEHRTRQQQNVQTGSRSCLHRPHGHAQAHMDMQAPSLESKPSIRRRKSRRRIMRRGIRKGGGGDCADTVAGGDGGWDDMGCRVEH